MEGPSVSSFLKTGKARPSPHQKSNLITPLLIPILWSLRLFLYFDILKLLHCRLIMNFSNVLFSGSCMEVVEQNRAF